MLTSAYATDGRPQVAVSSTLESSNSRARARNAERTGATSGGLTAAEQYLAPVGSEGANQTFDDAQAEERMLRLLRAE